MVKGEDSMDGSSQEQSSHIPVTPETTGEVSDQTLNKSRIEAVVAPEVEAESVDVEPQVAQPPSQTVKDVTSEPAQPIIPTTQPSDQTLSAQPAEASPTIKAIAHGGGATGSFEQVQALARFVTEGK